MDEIPAPSVDTLRATLAAALKAREAAQAAYTEASIVSRAAEQEYDDALRAVRSADPLYTVLAEAMDASDLDARAHDHEEWCVSVDRFQHALGQRGYQITRKTW